MIQPVAILDVDGTLVDTNYQHAIAWFRALREHGAVVPVWRIHRHIGMGADQIVAAVAGKKFELRYGEQVRATEAELYDELIDEVEPLPGARELVHELRERGHAVTLASSATEPEVERYIELLDVRELIDGYTTSADVERTKPEPDLVQAALAAIDLDGNGASVDEAVFIGDSTFDCEAARRAGIESIGLLSGGFGADELMAAGAKLVLEDAEELRLELGKTPLTA
jgi:HAD superfamily hydrolase (TIGR01509 family)